MSSSPAPDADTPPVVGAEEAVVLGADGQPLTKSGLKKLQKIKELEAKKAASAAAAEARAAAAAAKAAADGTAGEGAVKKVRQGMAEGGEVAGGGME